MVSEAFADTVTAEPDTVAPFAGAVMVTVGMPLTSTRGFGTVGCACPPCAQSTVAPTCPRTDLGGVSTYTADLRGRPVTILVAGTRADVIDDASCARTTLDLTNR